VAISNFCLKSTPFSVYIDQNQRSCGKIFLKRSAVGSSHIFALFNNPKFIQTQTGVTIFFFPFIFLGFFVYMFLCRPSEASTRYCVIQGGYPP
jgi:hypothetical protein